MGKTTKKETLRYLDATRYKIGDITPVYIQSCVKDIRSVESKDILYVIEWEEKHFLEKNTDPLSFSLVYKNELNAKAIALDLAMNLKNSEYFSIYVPRCSSRSVRLVTIYVYKESDLTIKEEGKKMTPKIGVLFSNCVNKAIKSHYLGCACNGYKEFL